MKSELNMLRRDLAVTQERGAAALPALDQMLTAWTEDWPAKGLSEDEMIWIDQGIADDPDARHRLAAKLPHRANRNWLLRRNITALRTTIGLVDDPAKVSTEHFHLEEHRFFLLASAVAASLFLLYEGDAHAAAKRTSNIVLGVTRAATTLLERPHAAARSPARWQSVVTRAVFACHFALIVAEAAPQSGRADVETLNRLAVTFARKLLPVGDLVPHAAEAFLRLTTAAIHNMRWLSDADEIRGDFALDATMAAFTRALALWSSPSLVSKHRQLAADLLIRAGELPLSQSVYNIAFTELLCSLDVAIASSAAAGRSDLISDLVRLWPAAYRDWSEINPTWAELASRLAAAMAGPGPARDALLADTSFASSSCVRMLACET